MSLPKTYDRSSKRVHSGILPALYDKVDVSYPTTVKEIYTYSLFNPNTDIYRITAIIEIIYTDSTKDLLLSATKTFNDSGFD